TPVGAARLPEPLPMKPTLGPDGHPINPYKGPDLVQGPISPEAAPPGPDEELALPTNHSSAFQAEEFAEHNHVFVHVGTEFWQRQRLGHTSFVYVDAHPSFPGEDRNQLPSNLLNILNVFDPDQLHPKANFGPVGTIGYLGQGCALELSGFYIPQATA